MLVSIAFSSGSSVDSGGVAAAEDALVCSVDSGCGWRGVSCTWPAAMVLKAVVLADVSEEAMDRMCSESLAVVCLGIGGGGGGSRGGRGGGGGEVVVMALVVVVVVVVAMVAVVVVVVNAIVSGGESGGGCLVFCCVGSGGCVWIWIWCWLRLVSGVVYDGVSSCVMSDGDDAFWWIVDVRDVCWKICFDAWCESVCVCVLQC